jgi:hypothetical protein
LHVAGLIDAGAGLWEGWDRHDSLQLSVDFCIAWDEMAFMYGIDSGCLNKSSDMERLIWTKEWERLHIPGAWERRKHGAQHEQERVNDYTNTTCY